MVNTQAGTVNRILMIAMLFGLALRPCLALGQEVIGGSNLPSAVREEALVTISLKDADIRTVLRLIAESANVNIIVGPEVQASVTVRMENVPWEKAMDAILKTYGFAYMREKNIIRVTTVAQLKEEDLQTKTHFLNFATAATVRESIKGILSERGKIEANERKNALIITDVPSYLVEAARIIGELDAETVQVAIEARIMEVTLTEGEDLGFSWGMEVSATGAQRPMIWPFTTEAEWGKKWMPDDFPPAGEDAFKFGILDATGLSVALKMLRTKTDATLLQSPRITTLNNQEAVLTTGVQYPLPTYAFNPDRGQWEITGFEYLDLGITLRVTPNVNREGHITMKIHPIINEIGEMIPFGGGGGIASIPSFTTREAETQVMVRDGETIVIGGLMETKEQVTVSKVPFLGDIPVLGHLFRRETREAAKNVKTDLIIFITAHIIQPGGIRDADRLRLERLKGSESRGRMEINAEVAESLYKDS